MSAEAPSTSGKMQLPPHVLENLKNFNEALTALEAAMQPHLTVSFEQHLKRSAIEMARTDVSSLFAINSLVWSQIASKGQEPNEFDDLKIDLNRTKEYTQRFKRIADRKLAPRISKPAAKNFVRNALFDVSTSTTIRVEDNSESIENLVNGTPPYAEEESSYTVKDEE